MAFLARVVAGVAASTLRTAAVVVALSAAAVAVGVAVFDLRTAGALALYFTLWWTLLFAVLPFGMSRQAEAVEVLGSDPGAPSAPRLREKAVWTTLVAGAFFIAASWALPLVGL
jgi:predicted secreted protein